MGDIMERTYIRTFHLQYKNQSNDSKDHVICRIQVVFPKQWSMRHVRLAIEKTYNNNKRIIEKVIFLYMFMYKLFVWMTTTKRHSFNNFSYVTLFIFHIKLKIDSFNHFTFPRRWWIPKGEQCDMWNVSVGVSKKVYKDTVKEIDIIASQEDPSQQQHASNVWNHYFLGLYKSN